MNEKIYSTKQIVHITGVSVQRLHHWSGNGVFEPHDYGAGRGTSRLFSYQNLLEIIIAKNLSAVGLHINILKSVVSEIHDQWPDYFNRYLKDTEKNEKNYIIMNMVSHKSGVINFESFEGFSKKRDIYFEKGVPLIIIDLNVYKLILENKLKNLVLK